MRQVRYVLLVLERSGKLLFSFVSVRPSVPRIPSLPFPGREAFSPPTLPFHLPPSEGTLWTRFCTCSFRNKVPGTYNILFSIFYFPFRGTANVKWGDL